MTNDLLFQAWLIANNFDQQVWQAGLLRMLRTRFERSQQKIVIDGTGCEWPTKVYRVNEVKEMPR
jgi:hypothetical protein